MTSETNDAAARSAGPARRVILASGSRIRKQLLIGAGLLELEVIAADVDEASIRAELMNESDCIEPDMVAGVLARAKAEAVSALHPDALVIGADQVLALGRRMFEKPVSIAAAREQLDRLRGLVHDLHSAVVLAEEGEAVWGTVESAILTMRPFSDAFLDHYVAHAGDALLRSVGAYELEGLGIQLFEHIEGDYFTILGLPLLPLLAELRARKVMPE
jgi:septum formation protein